MSERTRVFHFVNAFELGGTERHVANLVRAHDRSGFELHLGCNERGEGFSAELAALVETVAEFPVRRLYGPSAWRQQVHLARHLKERRIQVLHAYGFYANCFAIPAAALARVPVIVASIRDIGATWTPMQRRVERWVCKLADSIHTNADAVRQRLIDEGYAPARIEVIRNGVDVERFRQAGRSRFREELGIPIDAPLVGVISRIQSVKGLEFFIDAAAIVARRVPEARFVIVGDAFDSAEERAYRQSLEARARDAVGNRLQFAGSRADVPTLLSDFTVSVLPSLTEGLPNVVLESMSAGVPVVATRVGGTPEIIEDGVNGVLVPARDPQRMAAAIEDLLNKPDVARGFAARGLETVRSSFSLERMARRTEDHYRTLLRRRLASSGDFVPTDPSVRGT